jgi:hypothetical protein
MKFALPCAFFIFAHNNFCTEKSFKNISQSPAGHPGADSGTVDLTANFFFPNFHHS